MYSRRSVWPGLAILACPSFFDTKPKHAACSVTQQRRDSRGVKATECIGLCMLLLYITTPSNSFPWESQGMWEYVLLLRPISTDGVTLQTTTFSISLISYYSSRFIINDFLTEGLRFSWLVVCLGHACFRKEDECAKPMSWVCVWISHISGYSSLLSRFRTGAYLEAIYQLCDTVYREGFLD